MCSSDLDGYTLLMADGVPLTVTPYTVRKLPYDAVRDFTAIGLLAYTPFMLTVHPSVPVNTVKEFIAYAKSRPDQLNVSTTGTGGIGHLGTASLATLAGLRFNYVPYKGTGPALTAALGNEVHFTMVTIGTSLPYARNGRLRALGVSSAKPSVLLPGLTTIAAAGLPGYESSSLQGVFAPAGVPAPILQKLTQEIVRYLHTADAREKFLAVGVETVGSTPEQFTAAMKAEMNRMGKVIRDAGIRED